MAIEIPPRPISDLVGIGPSLANSLESEGYVNDIDLLAWTAIDVAEQLQLIDGLTYTAILTDLIPQARFLRLPGCEPQIAKAIVDFEIASYSELCFQDSDTLFSQLADILVGTIFENDLSLEKVQLWQLEAALRAQSALLKINVFSEDDQPLDDVRVETIGNGHLNTSYTIAKQTDANGCAHFELLAPIPHAFACSKNNFATQTILLDANVQSGATAFVELGTDQFEQINISEFTGGLVLGDPSANYTQSTFQLDDLAIPPPFVVMEVTDDEAICISLWRTRVGNVINSPRVRLQLNELPPDITSGLVIEPDDAGSYQIVTGTTAEEFRTSFVEERLAELE